MNRLQTTLALCLLGLLAASLADETAQTEQVDAGLDRETREVSEDVNTDVDRYEDVMNREKRHLADILCGHCHVKPFKFIERACRKLKHITYKVKSRCGWWRRRHTCYKIKHKFVWTRYCCKGKMVAMGLGKVCIRPFIACGGFFKSGYKYPACIYFGVKICSPRYKRIGSNCYKK